MKGISLPMLLFIIFLVLKLTGNIAWSWIWVTAPLWIGIPIWLGVFLIMIVVALFLNS